MDELDDEVLTELGRVTWASLHLEDGVSWTCVLSNPDDDNARQISERAKAVKTLLGKQPASLPRDAVIAWLDKATDVLDRHRNQIMHARPLVAPGVDEASSVSVLGVMPRRGRGGRPDRPYGERPLTVEHLREAFEEIVAVEREANKILLLAHAVCLSIG